MTEQEEGTMRIYVGNLDWVTTEDELEELFAPYGIVNRTRIATWRDSGRSRGFGFVEMPDATEAQAAIDGLNGTSIEGRPLTVSEARPRDERGGPGRASRRPRW
jgi:RNA recognition motif-containing protein